MRILIADDEAMALEELKNAVEEVMTDAEIFCTNAYQTALEQAGRHRYDIAMLDIRMPGMSGLELAKRLKDIHPQINIIFVTAYSEYALDAHEMYVSGYLLKPVTVKTVEGALMHLRYPGIQVTKNADRKLRIQCFGKFEVFYKEKPVFFQREKAKEIFAYLVDIKGSTANTDELCIALWEDDYSEKKKHYLRTLIRDIKAALKSCAAEDVLLCSRNSFRIDTTKVDCDYYNFLEKDAGAVNQYYGEYMKQYSWAEMTLGKLGNL